MALGRKQCGVTRCVMALDVGGELLIDPAIDVKSSDVKMYWESLFDMQHIKLLPGETPTYFVLQPLTTAQLDAFDAMPGSRSCASFAIRCSLTHLDNYLIDKDGRLESAPQPDRKETGRLGEVATEDWLAKVGFPPEQKNALFLMINHLSTAQLPLSKPSKQRAGPTENTTQENIAA